MNHSDTYGFTGLVVAAVSDVPAAFDCFEYLA